MEPTTFFAKPQNAVQKQYEALRAFYVEKWSGEEVAERFAADPGSKIYFLFYDLENP